MAVLDPCCILLETCGKRSLVQQGSWWPTAWDESRRGQEADAWIKETLNLTGQVLTALLHGRVTAEVYQQIVRLSPTAEALDSLVPPFNSAGHAIYVYMTGLDIVWDTFWDQVQCTLVAKPSEEPFIKKHLREFRGVLDYVAQARQEEKELVANEATESARLLLQAGRRELDYPLGPAIPSRVVETVLEGAKFFDERKERQWRRWIDER
jgi:hypothetical protein